MMKSPMWFTIGSFLTYWEGLYKEEEKRSICARVKHLMMKKAADLATRISIRTGDVDRNYLWISEG